MRDPNEPRHDPSMPSRRRFLQSAAWTWGAVAAGAGSWVLRPTWASAQGPIKVGIATDLTGAIGYAGNANANIAKLVVKEINGQGGVLGRPLELHIEDTASNESVAVANVRKLIQRDKVDVVFGGITSSMRNAIKDVIVTRGRTLYIYPQLYEGKECTPYIYCTGPTPAQQCDEFIPWLMKNGGKRFALPSANYVWPHVLNQYARKVIEGNGGEVIFEEYYPLDQVEYSATVNKIMTNKVDVVFNTVIPPGVGPFFKQLCEAAVKEARSVGREAVAKALDHAKISEGPGGPAEMVPGKRHCKMRMYTAVAKQGTYDIVARSKGLVDPKEC